MDSSAVQYSWDALLEEDKGHSQKVTEDLRQRFSTLDLKNYPLEALILLDHMTSHSNSTTAEPIEIPSEVEERFASAGITLPGEVAWICQPNFSVGASQEERERQSRDEDRYLQRLSEIFRHGDFQTCLVAATEAALANYLFSAYHEGSYIPPDFFLRPLIDKFPNQTQELRRYAALQGRIV